MPFKTVIFDFDSTLVTLEGINELARLRGYYHEIAGLTQQAMDGSIAFDQVFYHRLNLIRPTKADLAKVSELYVKNITPGAQALIQSLLSQNIDVFCITGGYFQAIFNTVKLLGINLDHVFAIKLAPDPDGYYTQVAENELLVNHDGKKQLIEKLSLQRKIAFIGDGHTDAQTIPVVDRFIGFAGVTQSSRLKTLTDYHISELSLTSVIKYLN